MTIQELLKIIKGEGYTAIITAQNTIKVMYWYQSSLDDLMSLWDGKTGDWDVNTNHRTVEIEL